MKRKFDRKTLILIGALLFLLTFSVSATSYFKNKILSIVSFSSSTAPEENLALENALLREQIAQAQELITRELTLLNEQRSLPAITQEGLEALDLHTQEILNLFPEKLKALPATVVFRSPHSWNSTLWINRGSRDNDKLGRPAIEKNSPVLDGTSLIGIVEEVHLTRSKVRLITDPRLSPSVRAARGAQRFAKGELHGSALSHWRSRGTLLVGEGFNYDFDDEYGPSKDLHDKETPILKVGDLLVTTGMDGTFPPGLSVATITKISPLREGDYYYDIEATPTAENLEEIKTVYVLPIWQ